MLWETMKTCKYIYTNFFKLKHKLQTNLFGLRPSPLPVEFNNFKLFDVEIKYGLMQVKKLNFNVKQLTSSNVLEKIVFENL